MQDLIFKNHVKVLFIIILGLMTASAITLADMANVDVPLPLLILGTLAAFLASCFIFYSKASMGQTMQIAITGILINAVIITGSHFLNLYSNMPHIILKPSFILNIDPLVIASGFVFSVLALCVGLKLGEPAKEKIEKAEEEIAESPEEQQEHEEQQKEPEKEQTEPVKTAKETVEISEEPAVEAMSLQDARKLLNGEAPEEKTEEPSWIEEPENGELASLEPEELSETIDLEAPEETLQLETAEEMPETKADYIPTDIRLVQNLSQKDTGQKGKIGSIGKLLVNNKNIENISESEEMLNSETTVITTVSGQKIYEKFDEIKNEFSCIKEMALIDDGGFIIANNFEDKQRVQIAGALVAGAYHTLQNYLSQISLTLPVRIFFETENTNSFIVKTKSEILFSVWEKDFKQVDYGPLDEIIEADDFENLDIIPYADLIKVEQFTVSNSEGTLVNSMGDAADSQLFAAVSSAMFENIKVFLMNIRMFNLTKLVVFTPQKTITIVKPEDKIVSFLTDAEESPNVSEELLKMEALQ